MIDSKELAEAMRRYGYEMSFSGRKVKDMRAIGYLWLAHRHGLEGIESSLLYYNADKSIRAVVSVTVILNGNKYTALADMDDRSVSVRSPDMVVRAAETAALKRAIARALFIDRDELQKYSVGGKAMEEEVETPVAEEKKGEKEKKDLDW